MPAPGRSPRPGPHTSGTVLQVGTLGADGDGIAQTQAGPLYLPGALPGETVRIEQPVRRGQAWSAPSEVLAPSPDRATPPCPHFGPCGGCAVQHLAGPAYLAWKRQLVADALARLDADIPLAPPARTGPGERRRMDLALRRTPSGILVGLHARQSDQVIDMQACPVLHPTLFALATALRPMLRSLSALRRDGSALVNLLDTGPDLLLRTDGPLAAADHALLARFAAAHGVPRIAWAASARDAPQPACTLGPVHHAFGGMQTPMPPGAFLQASAAGESAIAAAVLAALPPLKPKARLIELFAGCGTLTHALATRARVAAYESDPAAIAALRAARNPRVTATLRDLARQPLQPAELAGAAAIVLDPPWAGAAAQMPALAQSGLPVLYVACNPASLARDGRVLRAAGYRAASAAAIDQFLWSARIEAVVGFVR